MGNILPIRRSITKKAENQREAAVKKLKQAFAEARGTISGITHSWPLENITEDEMEAIDREAKKDEYVASQKSRALKLLVDLPADHGNQHDNLLEVISETVVYLELKDKLSLSRCREGNEQRPDFKIEKFGADQFMEVKAPAMAGGSLNRQRYQEDALEGKVALEEQRAAGATLAMHEQVIAPMNDGRNGYRGDSTSYWVSVVVRKLEANIKRGQFKHGRTILAVDLRQLLLIGTLEDETNQYWKDIHDAQVSGVLWHTCFGLRDQKMFRPTEWEGERNLDAQLAVQGVLLSFPCIDGICFRYHGLHEGPRYVGFTRRSDGWARQILDAFCASVQLCD